MSAARLTLRVRLRESAMRTMRLRTPSPQGGARQRPGPGRDLGPLLTGAATAVAGTGALLARTDSGTAGGMMLFAVRDWWRRP